MLDRTRSYARAHRPGRVESALRACAALLLIWLAPLNPALARASQLYLRLPADMPAATSQRLLSALEAQLADLASIALTEPIAERALGIVSIAESAGTLSIQFADAQAEAIGAPRLVAGGASERSASEVASIVRAFVVARLDQDRTSAAESEARAQAERIRRPAQKPAPESSEQVARAAPAVARDAAQAAPAAAAALPTPASTPEAAQPLVAPAPATVAQRPLVVDRPDARAAVETWRLRLLAAYTGTTYAEQLPWHDGLRVDASTRVRGPLYLGASYGYQLPAEVTDVDTAVQIRIDAHALNAFAGLGRTWRSFGVALDAGVGAAKTLRSTTQAPGLQRNPEVSYWNVLVTLRLHGRLRFPAAPRLALDLAPALELAPAAGESLVATPDGEKNAMLSPRLWRARLDLGASFDVF